MAAKSGSRLEVEDDAVERPLWVTASPKRKARHKAGPEEHLQSFVLKALRRKPIVNFLPSLILGYAVALLDLAFELLTAAVDGS